MIDGLTNAGAIPVLERVMQFAGARHRLLTHNIANLSTPQFRPLDVSVPEFQAELSEAIDQRRARPTAGGDDLKLANTDDVEFRENEIVLHPKPAGENILFHDQNDRDLDRTMQGLVENFLTFRMAAQFMRKQFDTVQTAIRERL